MQATEPLATFLDYCTYGYMIDNVVLIVAVRRALLPTYLAQHPSLQQPAGQKSSPNSF